MVSTPRLAVNEPQGQALPASPPDNGKPSTASTISSTSTTVLDLPPELIQTVLAHLDAFDLARLAQTCRALAAHSYDDQVWQPILNANLTHPIASPAPCKSFRDLYLAHYPYWFLVRKRIWFGDSEPSGKLLLARYNAARASIEAYTVLATRGPHELSFWEKDHDVIIHSFDPNVRLDLHQAVLKLDVDSPMLGGGSEHTTAAAAAASSTSVGSSSSNNNASMQPSYYSREILMDTFGDEGLFSSFMLTRALPSAAIADSTLVWPPLRFPSHSRARNDTHDRFSSAGHRPVTRTDVSHDTFRLRRWVEYTGRHHAAGLSATMGFGMPTFGAGLLTSPYAGGNRGIAIGGAGGAGGSRRSFRMPEFITTFATVPEHSWHPTPAKPWQGIWCGDYSGHGCEFLLITQPDRRTARPLPERMGWLRDWFRGQRRSSTSSASSDSSFVSAAEDLDANVPAAGQYPPAYATAAAVEAAIGIPGGAGIFGVAPPLPLPADHLDIPSTHAQDYDDVPSGRLEAIKLTGDPNIPRGEYTFIAPDIGHDGFLRVADEELFRGARVVRSAGHIAGRGFLQDQYTPSQLVLISHDRLAQYWEAFGHISYYQRVDLDALMDTLP